MYVDHLGMDVDIVCQRMGHCHGSRGAKGGGTMDEDWAGVEEQDGTDKIGCFPLYKVAADTGRGFENSGSSPGRD